MAHVRFNKQEEFDLLSVILVYSEETDGDDPFKRPVDLSKFIIHSNLWTTLTEADIQHNISKLKTKFRRNKRKIEGKSADFSLRFRDPIDKDIFELSTKLWGEKGRSPLSGGVVTSSPSGDNIGDLFKSKASVPLSIDEKLLAAQWKKVETSRKREIKKSLLNIQAQEEDNYSKKFKHLAEIMNS